MNYNSFIKKLAEECNDNGVHITQPKLKKIFEIMSDIIVDSLDANEEDRIKLRSFLIFEVIEIPPKRMPNGTESERQYSVRVRLSNEYKKRLKDELNK